MKKKAAIDRDTIIGFIIGLVVLAIILWGVRQYSSGSFMQFNAAQLKQSRDACKALMERTPPPTDDDHDGFPDNVKRLGIACDLCLNGDDNLDDDGDGVPDDCDSEPNVPMSKKSSPKKECKGRWNNKLDRCEI